MKTATFLLLAGGVVAAGGVAFVVVKRKQAAAASGGDGLCASVAQPIGRMYGFDIPPAACGLVNQVAGRLVDAFTDKDAKNRQLNGEIEIPLTPETKSIAAGYGGTEFVGVDYLDGSVLRFKNGCEPFDGAPGKNKCAAGTFSMRKPVGFITKTPGVRPAPFDVAYVNAKFKALIGETHKDGLVRNSAMFTAEYGDPTTSVQLGILGGVKATCPAGEKVLGFSPVRDERSGTLVRTVITNCGKDPAEPVELVGLYGDGGRTEGGIVHTQVLFPPGDAPAGYHWVQPVPPELRGHWERDRAVNTSTTRT